MHLAGLIKLPCRVVPAPDPDLTSLILYCDLVDDRGLRFATVWERAVADRIAEAINRGGCTDYEPMPQDAAPCSR